MNNSRELAKIEGNFIESFPAHFERARSRRSRPDAPVETITTPNGKITINHHSRLFTAFDMDVMLAAFALAYRHTERRFRAILADFARVMRINPFGKNLVRIRESLNELALTPAEFVESWRDAQNRRYTSEAVTSFIAYRLVDRREIVEAKLSPKTIRDGSWIAIPDLFYDSIAGGYFKYIDTDVYFSLPSGLCRAAFLYLEKRLGMKNYYEENIGSALANIIKRPVKPQDIKDFKRRTIPKLSGVFHFDKTKLENGNIGIVRRLPLRSDDGGTSGVAATTNAMSTTTTAAGKAVAATAAAVTTIAAPADGDFIPHTAVGGSPNLSNNNNAPPPPNRVEPRSKVPRPDDGAGGAPPRVRVEDLAIVWRGEPRPNVRPPLHKNLAAHSDIAQVSPSAGWPPPRKKLTSHGEYVLERACIFCNRDDDYFKNVIRKYIFLRGADLVAGAIGDTRDSNAESKDRYFIHLLKNL